MASKKSQTTLLKEAIVEIEKQKQTVNQKTVCYKLGFTKIFFESYTAIYYK